MCLGFSNYQLKHLIYLRSTISKTKDKKRGGNLKVASFSILLCNEIKKWL